MRKFKLKAFENNRATFLFLRTSVMAVGVLLMVLPAAAFAICPLCTVAVGAGIGFAQWLGVDDVITGLWIGGLTVSMIVWTLTWLHKKEIHFFGEIFLIAALYYAVVVSPLCWKGIVGHALNKLWGVDKLLLGIAIGSFAFAAGALGYAYLKNRNGGKANFPFQKVVMPIAPLIVLSVAFYFLTR